MAKSKTGIDWLAFGSASSIFQTDFYPQNVREKIDKTGRVFHSQDYAVSNADPKN